MKKNKHHFLLALVLLAAGAAPSLAQEAKLIAVLQSKSSQEEKAAACRQLALVGTPQAVPALAALLDDEKLSHMARYALETIRDPAVDEALRTALGKLKGRPLLGVIGSLGVRRDAKAVDSLAKFLGGSDTAAAQAAAHALGNLGTPEAAKALDSALPGAAGADQKAVCEGLLRCAEALRAQGQNAVSLTIYDRLRELASAPPPVRAAALRGAILARGKAGIPILLDAVRASDYALTAAAARAALELPGPEVTAALSAELSKPGEDRQILLINTLGYRGDASAGPALLAAASNGSVAVRLVAVENLTHLGYAPALPLLARLSLSDEAQLAAVAKTCLQNFPSQDADATVLAMLSENDAKVRGLAIQMVAQRNIAGANSKLLKACDDVEDTVRLAAFKALAQRASAAELPALLKAMVKARSAADVQAAEGALIALCVRESKPASGNVVIAKALYGDLSAGLAADVTVAVAALTKAGGMAIEASNSNFGDPANGHVKMLRVDYQVNGVGHSKTVPEGETLTISALSAPPAIADSICAVIPAAQGDARLAILRSLRMAGGPRALQAIRDAAASGDPRIKDMALRVLCDWNTPDALPSIIEVVATPPTKTLKILAMRGLVRLVPLDNATDAKKINTLKTAMTMADRDEERQLVLSALGNVPTTEALMLAAAQLENPVLREEACVAAVAIAEKVAHRGDAQVVKVMQRVAKLTNNRELATRAAALAK